MLTIYGMNVQMQEHSDDDAECKSKKKDREDKPRWGVGRRRWDLAITIYHTLVCFCRKKDDKRG